MEGWGRGRGVGGQEVRTGVSCTCTLTPLNQFEASDISPLPAPFELLIFSPLEHPPAGWGQRFQREYFLMALKVYVALCYKGCALKLGFLLSLSPLSPSHTPPWRNRHTSLFHFLTPPKSIFKNMGKTFRRNLVQVFHFAE